MGLRNTFGTVNTDLSRNNTINVESLNAFPDPVGNIITLNAGNPTYRFTQSVNTGVFEFVIPDGSSVTFETSNTVANVWTTEIAAGKSLLTGNIAELAVLGLDITSTNGGECFTLNAGVGVIPLLFGREFRILGFDSIGTVDGIGIVLENIGYVSNGGGWSFNDITVLSMAEQNFVLQTGDPIAATGTTSNLIFRDILGNPSTGDQLFNFDTLTVTGSSFFSNIIFSDVNGGTIGLTKTFTADTTLDSIFTDIHVDTTSNTVEIELPDITGTALPDQWTVWVSDQGNAGTNLINVIPNALDSTTIDGLSRFDITTDDAVVGFKLIDGNWVVIGNRGIFTIKEVSTTYTALQGDEIIIGDTTGGAFTITLPTAVGIKGREINIKKAEGAASVLTIEGFGSETIDNNLNIKLLGSKGPSITLNSDNIGWVII